MPNNRTRLVVVILALASVTAPSALVAAHSARAQEVPFGAAEQCRERAPLLESLIERQLLGARADIHVSQGACLSFIEARDVTPLASAICTEPRVREILADRYRNTGECIGDMRHRLESILLHD